MVAGLVDSFGLSLGWTVFNLLAVAKGGLAAAGAYNAAVLIGVVASAPVTAWLAGWLNGRALLSATAGVEIALRVGTLVALLAGWPTPVIAAGIGALLITVVAVYAASLLPTFSCARRARVPGTRQGRALGAPTTAAAASPGTPRHARGLPRMPVGALAAGAVLMLLASGPTRLSVAFAAELHGQAAVAGVARDVDHDAVTRLLAWSASIRALGGAVAVRLLPMLVAAPAIGVLSGVVTGVITAGGLLAWAAGRALRPARPMVAGPAAESA
jgi:hypothetical protein